MFGSNQVMINYSQEEKFGILLEVDNFPINRHLTRLNTLQYYDARSPKEPLRNLVRSCKELILLVINLR